MMGQSYRIRNNPCVTPAQAGTTEVNHPISLNTYVSQTPGDSRHRQL